MRRDFPGRGRALAIAEDDLPAIMSADAYGTSMPSNHNTRLHAAEVMVDRETLHVIGDRETVAALMAKRTFAAAKRARNARSIALRCAFVRDLVLQ